MEEWRAMGGRARGNLGGLAIGPVVVLDVAVMVETLCAQSAARRLLRVVGLVVG